MDDNKGEMDKEGALSAGCLSWLDTGLMLNALLIMDITFAAASE